MARRPTEGTEADRQLAEMCDNARRVVGFCEALGFLDAETSPVHPHLHHAPPFSAGHLAAHQELGGDDGPYVWELSG